MKKLLGILFLLLNVLVLTACGGNDDNKMFEVKFDTGTGGTIITAEQVKNGNKVKKPDDPTRDGYVFNGKWNESGKEWIFEKNIVTKNITLVAGWIEVSEKPTDVRMGEEEFSSFVYWNQKEASLDAKVFLKAVDAEAFTEVLGTVTKESKGEYDVVKFTPNIVPQGGDYFVKVVTGTEEIVTENTLLFAGSGSKENPFLVSKNADIIAILTKTNYGDKNFVQVQDILQSITNPIEITDERKITFSGSYDGSGKSLSYSGNGGLFHSISETGTVKNIIIDTGTKVISSENNKYPVGVLANENHGLIENITSRGTAEDLQLSGNLPVFNGTVDVANQQTGAGGIVGVNKTTGIISKVTASGSGAVKAARGVGGIAAYNHGLIKDVVVTATLPAGNQANTGKSSNAYSYGGGVAGFNFGTIERSTVSGRVFAQSAYNAAGNGNENKNVVFGGIAGYNEGTIRESTFERQLTVKEFIDKSRADELGDVANNLGVASIHGDAYVGGIAGINAGTITDVYVSGALVAARDFVGGITALSLNNATVKNAYVFAEVAIKDDSGKKLTAPDAKTTLTTYEIAPTGGFDAPTTIFKRLLNELGTTWTPESKDTPRLPTFTPEDHIKLGTKFAQSGALVWQTGTVTGINITLEEIALAYGEEKTLEYVINPTNAPDKMVFWTSSDESIVKITGDGQIKGVAAGEAIVTATTRDGGHTDTIKITVADYTKIKEFKISSSEITLPEVNNKDVRMDIERGTTITIVVEILTEDATFKGYTITVSNTRAIVDGNKVTFVADHANPGSVSIIINFEDASIPKQEYRFTTK